MIGRAPKPMLADYDQAVREHRIDPLLVGAELAGLIETVNQGDRLLIENVAVAPAFQGRGHGRRLLEHAERLAGSLGCRRSSSIRSSDLPRTSTSMRSRGYTIDREEPITDGVIVHMKKRVATI